MKKVIFAMLALCVATLSFTSCERKADPASQPIAGKTYKYTDADGYVKFRFNLNYSCEIEALAKEDIEPTKSGVNTFVWDMKDGKTFTIRYANGVINTQTGQNVSGVLVYNGVLDAATKKVTITMVAAPYHVYVCTEE